MELNDLKRVPEYKRKRLRLGRRGSYVTRPKFSAERLAAYLRENQIRSASQLRRLNKERDDAPTLHTCLKVLGVRYWNQVLECAWGKEPAGFACVKHTHETMVSLATRFSLTSRKAWDSARKRDKKLVPSRYVIERLFGSMPSFLSIVADYSTHNALECYQAACLQAGKSKLTERECRHYGVNLTALRKLMPKRDLDGLLSVIPNRQ